VVALWAWLLACGGALDGAPGADAPDPVDAEDALVARRVRLLTREEYRNTVTALLPQLGAATCEQDADCNLEDQSCDAGVCAADPCARHTFVWRAGGVQGAEVVVAGSFNGWAPTASAGALPMAWVPEQGLYYAKATLTDAAHSYKFVVDGSRWLADPANPQTTPDGFGGQNSVVVAACAGAAPPDDGAFDPTAGWLPESRPAEFAFDNHAEAGLVSADRADAYLTAAAAIAARVVPDAAAADAWLGCRADDDACLSSWIASFGARAWRRPLSAEEVLRLQGYALAEPDRGQGVSVALQVLLASPSFLYRPEVGAPQGDRYVLDGVEASSALSYFLWGAPPDDALEADALAGALATGEGREAAARRMWSDPRARQTVRRFALAWLGVEPLATVAKSSAMFPAFDEALRAAMREETADFVEAVVFDGGGRFDDLLTARWTVADAPLRALYGLPSGEGRVDLPAERAGVLGHASILAVQAHSDQTSPIRRGLFVRQRLLCEQFAPPPAAAGGVPDVDPSATTRERFAQHSADPACATCHRFIDPLGFGFEAFDALGAHRTTEHGLPIDASGELRDVEGQGSGTSAPFASLPELGAALAASEAAPACFVAQVVRFALGADVRPDDPRLAALQARFQASGHDVEDLWVAVAGSSLFVERAP
jgi:hypothetical protein